MDIQNVYTLNDTAGTEWQLLKFEQPTTQILTAIEQIYTADNAQINKNVEDLIDEFITLKFVKAALL